MMAIRVASASRRPRALLALLGLALLAQGASAAVVFDSTDGGGAFHPQNNQQATRVSVGSGFPFFDSTFRAAAKFTVSGDSYTLDSITLPISVSKTGTSDDILRVRLTSDSGGAPGATLEILSENQAWPPFANPFTTSTTLLSTSHPTLVEGASYWIVTEPTAIPAGSPVVVDYRWFGNTSGGTVPFRQQQVNSASLPADPWPGSAGAANVAVLVEGTVVPPPPLAFQWVNVPVGSGNTCDTQSQGCFGAVGYSYEILKYEVTNAQFAQFLNAIAASDPNGIYNDAMNITRSGSPGSYTYAAVSGRANQPLTALSFYDALRFANWLHNGQPTGAQSAVTTEDGAYTFSGPTTVGPRKVGATSALPTENEWYKAAYYQAPTASYCDWSTTYCDAQTTCSMPTVTPGRANCDTAVNDFTDVGSYTGSPSHYGTFDQGGNAWEWNETLIGSDRGVRGGSWGLDSPSSLTLGAAHRFSAPPASEGIDIDLIGFRVVRLVPEPGSLLQLVVGIAALLALARRT